MLHTVGLHVGVLLVTIWAKLRGGLLIRLLGNIRLGSVALRFPIATMVCAFFAVAGAYSVGLFVGVSGFSAGGAQAQVLPTALACCVSVAFYRLVFTSIPIRPDDSGDDDACGIEKVEGGKYGKTVCGKVAFPVVVSAFAACLVGMLVFSPRLCSWAVFVVTCALVAVFEETLFRGVVISCSVRCLSNPFSAALLSAVLFALVHVSSSMGDACVGVSNIGSASGQIVGQTTLVLVQLLVKLLQGILFGLCMAVLFIETSSIVLPIIVHVVYDMLYFAPYYAAFASFPSTYATGAVTDVVVLALSVVLLIPPSLSSMKMLSAR